MKEMIEAIRAAVADGATPEQKALGAQACRTILAALGAEPGKPINLPSAPPPPPLAGITPDQALDLLITRLTSIAEAREAATTQAATSTRSQAAPQIAFVNPSPAARHAASAAPARRRPR